MRISRASTGIWALVVSGLILRIAFGLWLDSPFNGPDAIAYHKAAIEFAQRGVTASGVTGIPYMPAGYPLLIGLLYWLFGVEPRIVLLIQTIVLAAATYSTYQLIRREIDERIAFWTIVVMTLVPSLLLASAFFMYETVTLGLLVIGVDLVSRAARASHTRQAVILAAAAGLTLGITVPIQPKVLLTGAFVLLWLALITRRFVLIIGFAAAFAMGPVLGAARTYVAEDRPVLAANLGVVMVMGFNDKATGGYLDHAEKSCPQGPHDLFEQDQHLIHCAIDWSLAHPLGTAEKIVLKTAYFWSPMIGPPNSWMYKIDPRHALPANWESAPSFETVDEVIRALWTMATLLVISAGTWMLLRRKGKSAMLILLPTLSFLAATWITVGDARYRLPVLPFYVPLQLTLVLWLAEKVGIMKKSDLSGDVGAHR